MTAEDWSPEQGAVFDLSARAKLRVSGSDRLRFLNGQISNDLRKAAEDAAIHACVLNAKGRINADVFLVAAGDSYLLDVESEMRETLATRLERYVIADDVQITEVTDEFSLFHVLGATDDAIPEGARIASADRFGFTGTDVWLPGGAHEIAGSALSSALPFCDERGTELFRIERGIPRWGRELTDEIIPVEANLEASAIDYAKGCYIGQEVISRMKMSGQTNKRLCGLVAESDAPLAAGMRLFANDDADQKDVGWLTSVARSTRLGQQIALGFVKRGFNLPGTKLAARVADHSLSNDAAVRIVAVPFI